MTEVDPTARFDGKTISYTYDNGWAFTNTFDGTVIATIPSEDDPAKTEIISAAISNFDG